MMRVNTGVVLYLFTALILANFTTPALAEKRVALVIGNSAYEYSARLTNPKNDARDMAASFVALKFTKVIVQYDLKYSGLRQTLANFSRIAVGADLAVIYYSGHGIEVSGQNYLIPVDAKLSHAEDVAFEATPLTQAMVALERAGKFRLVILDACRDNPFRARMKSSGSTRSIGRGLAPVAAGANTLVAYASRDGTVAFDGDGSHSPYTTALLEHMAKPGIEIGYLFRLVRDSVMAATSGRQEPFTYGSLGSRRIYLKPGTALQPKPAPVASSNAAREWQSLSQSTDVGDLEAYIAQFGTASPYYARKAKKRLKALQEQNVASLPSENSEDLAKIAAEQAKAKRDLAFAVQTELKRVGCDPGGVDGAWGANSAKAVRAFAKHANIALASTDPSTIFLESLRRQRSRVCPEEIKIPPVATQRLAGISVRIAPTIGAPEKIGTILRAKLKTTLSKYGVSFSDDNPAHIVRAYVVADGQNNKLAYQINIIDPSGKRLDRIDGQNSLPTGKGIDPWDKVSSSILENVAENVAAKYVSLPINSAYAVRSNSGQKASYIAQVAVRRSREAALTSFADLQRRFGAVLSKKSLDLQKADLGSRGTWYRLRVGPPGSKQDMTELCNKLRSVGHRGCIIRAY